ncbi:MAG: class I adenylate-forming enzyme family protein [Acidimicrobiales bacterium]
MSTDLPLTIGSLIEHRAGSIGTQDFFVCDDERLTYADANAQSRELARGLVALGVGRSTHVGLLMPSSAAYIVGWLAVTRIGAVAVPISTFSTADELRWLIRNANVAVLLSAHGFRSHDYTATLQQAFPELKTATPGPLHLGAAPSLRWVFVDGDVPAWAADRSMTALADLTSDVDDAFLSAVEADVAPSDRMVIVHTSGSTSTPKGVIHQHGALIEHTDNLNGVRGLTAAMKLFSNSPLFWIGGLAYNVVGTLAAGSTLICSASADSRETLDLIERERPDMVNGFAQTVAHLVKDPTFASRDFSSIRFGNLYPIMPDDVRPADPELRHNMLGMTETGSVCLMSGDESDLPERYRGSFGKPVPALETRIVDPDTHADCEAGQLGELWMRGPLLMEGYYGRERHEVFTPDGWFRGGDLFSVDDDGFHYFKGRRGDMIKTGGANVSPREVESALRDVIPEHATLVVGLPDGERGQIVVAVVIAPEGVEVDEHDITARLRQTLSHYKVPRRIIRLAESEIPMLSSGKVDGKRLLEVLRGR